MKSRLEEQRMEGASGVGTGYVSETFSSFQGEGIFVGERQIFVRTAGCTLTCSWCDTLYSKVHTPRFVVHDTDKRTFDNPVDVETVVREAVALSGGSVRTVSITGGEPFEQGEFTRALARRFTECGMRVYMETNGVHAAELAAALPWIDVIAMDIKLPSALGVEAWDAHAAFLGVLAGSAFDPVVDGGSKRVFVKVVIDPDTKVDEVVRAARIVSDFSKAVPLVLQPESGALLDSGREGKSRLLGLMAECHRQALTILDDVRVVPQCHKILNVR